MRVIFIGLMTLLFAGCEYIEVASCSDSSMTEVKAGDLLKNNEENTRIKIVHTAEEKKICVSQGSASIFRK